MDKETLSNYGWIVICVLVLAVMIALASPFGTYVSDAVKSTTQGLFDVQQGALSAAGIDIEDQSFEPSPEELIASGIVPEGGIYTTADGTVYNAGDTISTITDGDTYTSGDYEYRYNQYFHSFMNEWHTDTLQNGWSVRVLDRNKTEYGTILSNINGQSITNMSFTFCECTSLETAPTIPNSVTDMYFTFVGCTALTTAPVIPSSVERMNQTFNGCTSLTGNIEINATPTDCYGCFENTTKEITLSGSSTKLDELATTSPKGNVTVAQ